jgi:hypothetical protein
MQIFGRRTANFKFHCIKNKEQFWIHIFGSLYNVITKLYIKEKNQIYHKLHRKQLVYLNVLK